MQLLPTVFIYHVTFSHHDHVSDFRYLIQSWPKDKIDARGMFFVQ